MTTSRFTGGQDRYRRSPIPADGISGVEGASSYVPPQTKELPMPNSLHYGLVTDRPNSTRPQPRLRWTRDSPRHLVIRWVN